MRGIRTTFIILSSIFPSVAISSSPPWDCDGWDPTEDVEVGGGWVGGTKKGGLNLFCLTGTAAGAFGGIFFGGMAITIVFVLIVGDEMSG